MTKSIFSTDKLHFTFYISLLIHTVLFLFLVRLMTPVFFIGLADYLTELYSNFGFQWIKESSVFFSIGIITSLVSHIVKFMLDIIFFKKRQLQDIGKNKEIIYLFTRVLIYLLAAFFAFGFFGTKFVKSIDFFDGVIILISTYIIGSVIEMLFDCFLILFKIIRR